MTAPARSVGSARRLRKKIRRATRSTAPSRRRVLSPIVWPTSSIRPTLWALIAARISGASAIRSTSRCASSLASSRRQTSSTSSLSRASIRARFTASLSSAPFIASSTSGALEHPRERPFHRLALDRGDHRLLGRGLDRSVDSGRLADGARAAHPRAEQPHRERQRLARRPVAGRTPELPAIGPSPLIAAGQYQALEQSIEERRPARGDDLLPRLLEPEPLGPIDLGELAPGLPERGGHSIVNVLLSARRGRIRPPPPSSGRPCRPSGASSRAPPASRRSSWAPPARAPPPARAGRRRGSPPRARPSPSGSTSRGLPCAQNGPPGWTSKTSIAARAAVEQDPGGNRCHTETVALRPRASARHAGPVRPRRPRGAPPRRRSPRRPPKAARAPQPCRRR